MALGEVVKEAIWLRGLFGEFLMKKKSLILFCDNMLGYVNTLFVIFLQMGTSF